MNIDLLILYDKNHFEAPWTSLNRIGKERIKKANYLAGNSK
jgi:hypothetical protein